jgi:hypothetical protein
VAKRSLWRRLVVAPDVVVDAVVEVEVLEVAELGRAPPRTAPRRRARGSIEPPMSRNSSTLTRLRRSGTRCMSSQPALRAVPSIVPSRSSSSGTPSRAKRRSRRSATLMLRVLSSTSNRRGCGTAARPRPSPRCGCAAAVLADADAFRVVAVGAERAGAAGADPLRAALVPLLLLLEPLASASPSASPSRRAPRSALLLGGQLALELPAQPLLGNLRPDVDQIARTPLKYAAKATSNRSKCCSSLTSVARARW